VAVVVKSPAPAADEDPSKGLARLRQEYARALPAKLDSLAAALDRLRETPGSADLLEAARLLAHRLRGTAGSYGFVDVSAAAGRIEDILVEAPPGGPGPAAWEGLEAALGDARSGCGAGILTHRPSPVFDAWTPRLLVVDDDPSFLEYIEELGRTSMIEIVGARTPEEALGIGRERALHAAILDVGLGAPDDSFRLARELRALPGCRNLPLAFCSSNAGIDRRVAAAHAGASLFLSKPLDPAAFDSAVRQLLLLQRAEMPRVLVVDDDEDFCAWVDATLAAHGMAVSALTEPSTILLSLEATNPDLLLLDALLPGFNGFEIAQMIRAIPRWQDLPIVFVTGDGSVVSRIAAFESGGDDYLTKPLIPQELLARTQVRIDRSRLLRERSDTDPLTGLLLRRPFLEGFTSRLAEAERHGTPLTICLLDIDLFKTVNDTHGHLAGDQVLAALGKLLTGRFRAGDLRGRWGGEEFALAFPGETCATIHGVVTRVLSEFRAMIFRGEQGGTFSVTFSAGIACFPDDGRSLEAILGLADRNLYEAKTGGRARVVGLAGSFQPPPDDLAATLLQAPGPHVNT
jgi:diguanylate cyclase (GGDEF)-like protein